MQGHPSAGGDFRTPTISADFSGDFRTPTISAAISERFQDIHHLGTRSKGDFRTSISRARERGDEEDRGAELQATAGSLTGSRRLMLKPVTP
jgi:hypothetical protein